jgi:hypothetical protein
LTYGGTWEPKAASTVLSSKKGYFRSSDMTAKKQLISIVFALAAASAGSANAQESERAIERLELTMTLLPEQAQDAAQITRRIELPRAATQGSENAQQPEELPGIENGRGEGLETAAEARERGREFGQDVAADARENRENAGRGENPPGPPENPPGAPTDRPGPPENPGRP